ncbi:MAG: 50S ribosomal protein L25/general stress protein Ctc [Propionibacteriaceae bacterium]
MAEVKLSAEMRTEFGKGAARRIRRADKIPAVLYGHGADPLHITLPGHETLLALREDNALLAVDVDGDSKLALPRQVQRDPIKGFIEHVDLLIVRRGEKVVVDVAIQTEGEAASETVVVVDRQTVSVEAEATNIPNYVIVSIEGMEAGTQVLAADLDLPEGSTLNEEDDILVVNVTNAPTQAELDADLEVEDADSTEGDEEAAGDEAAEDAEGEEKSD